MIMNWISRMRGDQVEPETAGALRDHGASPDGSRASAPLIDSDETLVGEFGRARRYEQTLTIAVVSAVPLEEPSRAAMQRADFLGATRPPDVLPLLAGAGLREALRESDVLCYRPADRRFVLGLVQTEAEAGRRAMDRVGELFRKRLRIDLIAGVAEFPADGLTLEDLIETARERAKPIDVLTPGDRSEEPRARRGESSGQRVVAPHRARPSRAASATGLSQEAARSE